jgi:hypothetical protein
MILEKIKDLVGFAYENVPLYRRLYSEKPELSDMGDFARLPYLTRSDFVLSSIEDALSDVDEVTAILPPIENQKLFPFPRMESAADRDSRYEVFYFLLSHVGVMDDATFLIITDSAHSYYCGEIANNLLYYGHPTWMMLLRDHSAHEVQEWIDRFEPDCVFLGLDRIPAEVTRWGVPSIFTINQHDQDISSGDDVFHFDIYAITEIGWVGIRLPGGCYIYPTNYFHIETDPQDNTITLTALASTLQPFIRYRTPDRGKILGDGKLQVTYIGEH